VETVVLICVAGVAMNVIPLFGFASATCLKALGYRRFSRQWAGIFPRKK
jgi:hypothetical protein